jgi:hypothetical protein
MAASRSGALPTPLPHTPEQGHAREFAAVRDLISRTVEQGGAMLPLRGPMPVQLVIGLTPAP